jgi:hypothetical protein
VIAALHCLLFLNDIFIKPEQKNGKAFSKKYILGNDISEKEIAA